MCYDLTIGLIIYDEIQYIDSVLSHLKTELNHHLSSLQVQWLFVLNHPDQNVKNKVLDQLKSHLTHFEYYHNTANNIGWARELILNKTQAPLLYFTDPDIRSKNQSLYKLYQHALADMDSVTILGWTGPVIHQSKDKKLDQMFHFLQKVAQSFSYSFQIQNHMFLQNVDHAPTCHLLLRKKIALDIGGFSSQFENVGEDLDFSHRAYAANKRFLFIPDAAVYHQQDMGLLNWLRKISLFGRVQILVQKRNWRRALRLYRFAPVALAATMLFCLYASPLFAAIVFFMLATISLVSPSILYLLFTFTSYAYGEFAELAWPKLKLKNAVPHKTALEKIEFATVSAKISFDLTV